MQVWCFWFIEQSNKYHVLRSLKASQCYAIASRNKKTPTEWLVFLNNKYNLRVTLSIWINICSVSSAKPIGFAVLCFCVPQKIVLILKQTFNYDLHFHRRI